MKNINNYVKGNNPLKYKTIPKIKDTYRKVKLKFPRKIVNTYYLYTIM